MRMLLRLFPLSFACTFDGPAFSKSAFTFFFPQAASRNAKNEEVEDEDAP